MPEDMARFDRLLRNFNHLSHSLQGVAAEPAARTARRRAGVVCWDLAHNPAGRAHVLCSLLAPDWEAELIGPIWPRFGQTLWAPLRNAPLRWHALHVETLTDVWREAAAVALARRFDVVIVTKPRLPGLILGLLLAEQSLCPLVFDFDEDERAFLSQHPSAAAPAEELLHAPFGTAGTLAAAKYWSIADAVTVASPVLRQALGGHLVRHARDEAAPRADREVARARLGYRPDDVVMAFVGTARPHKGLDRVLAAMDEIADPRLKLLIAGEVTDAGLLRDLRARSPSQVVLHGGCDLQQLGDMLAAADLVPLIQDPESPVAHSQFPAKLSDALQHGVRVVASATEPLKELAGTGAVDLIAPDGLAAYLAAWLRTPRAAPALIRRLFEDEFSLGVNRVRLHAALAEAEWRSNPFDRAIPEALRDLAQATRTASVEVQALACPAVARTARGFDLAFFWKQNDSDLFGRRADMLAKHLLISGRVRRIVHFDQPTTPTALRRMAQQRLQGRPGLPGMQFPNTAARAMRLADGPGHIRRVFVGREDGAARSLGGQVLAAPGTQAAFVAAQLREAGCDPENTLAWVCPVVWDFASIAEHNRFRRIIVDLIDDERSWSMSVDRRRRVQEEYENTLALGDLVLTNCEGNRARFTSLRPDIHVVPNGAELEPPPGTAPEFVARLRHPAIGYVGNLRERIDWPLVQGLAARHPEWDFVFIGPWGEAGIPEEVRAAPNIVLPGPLPYDAARLCLRQFDCAILPHTRDAMTDAMNPLKIYNYLAAGLPVVAAPVANLEEVQDMLCLAEGVDGFSAGITEALQSGTRPDPQRLLPLSWQVRSEKILALLDEIEG